MCPPACRHRLPDGHLAEPQGFASSQRPLCLFDPWFALSGSGRKQGGPRASEESGGGQEGSGYLTPNRNISITKKRVITAANSVPIPNNTQRRFRHPSRNPDACAKMSTT